MSVLPRDQATLRSDPDSSIPVFRERGNRIGWQSIPDRELMELSLLPATQTAAHTANPQRAPAVTKQDLHRPALKSLLRTKRQEVDTVKPAHSFISAHPNVAVTRLSQRAHVVFRQSLFPLPRAERKRCFSAGPRAICIDEITERRGDGHFAEDPSVAAAVAEMNLIERGVGLEPSGQALWLTVFGGTGAQVRV